MCLIRSPLNESHLGQVFQAHRKAAVAVYAVETLREHAGERGVGVLARSVFATPAGEWKCIKPGLQIVEATAL